jgi:hypothetical protein
MSEETGSGENGGSQRHGDHHEDRRNEDDQGRREEKLDGGDRRDQDHRRRDQEEKRRNERGDAREGKRRRNARRLREEEEEEEDWRTGQYEDRKRSGYGDRWRGYEEDRRSGYEDWRTAYDEKDEEFDRSRVSTTTKKVFFSLHFCLSSLATNGKSDLFSDRELSQIQRQIQRTAIQRRRRRIQVSSSTLGKGNTGLDSGVQLVIQRSVSLFPCAFSCALYIVQYIRAVSLSVYTERNFLSFLNIFLGGFFLFCSVQYSALLHLPPLTVPNPGPLQMVL